MPSLKVKVNTEAKAGNFTPYDGPEPKPGKYKCFVQKVNLRKSNSSDNIYFNVLLIVDEPKNSEKAKYNGAPIWHMIHMTDSDAQQARLAMFMKAVTGKDQKEQNVVHESSDALETSGGSEVKTIGGVKPVGKSCLIDLRYETSEEYGKQLRSDMMRAFVGSDEADEEADNADDEIDVDVEGDEEEPDADVEGDDEWDRDEREAELKKESLADLKAAAKDAGIDIKNLKKADLIEAILDWEEEPSDEDEEADEEEEEEVDSEEEEEADEEDEDEDDEEDAEAELRAELADLDRAALRTRIKTNDPEAKVLKKHSDDDLRDIIVEQELEEGDAPF